MKLTIKEKMKIDHMEMEVTQATIVAQIEKMEMEVTQATIVAQIKS